MRVQISPDAPTIFPGGCYVTAKRRFKSRSSKHFTVNGKTTDGKTVYGNVLKISESRGIPLDIILDTINKNGGTVDWIEFVDTSLEINWNITTTLNKIETACCDIFGKQNSEQIILSIKRYLSWKIASNGRQTVLKTVADT